MGARLLLAHAMASPPGRMPILFADEHAAGRATAPRTPSDSFARSRRRLGVTDEHVQPGYEDIWYYLWRERRLPVNVDPFDARLDDEMERDRLRRVFSQGLGATVGFALAARRERPPIEGRAGEPDRGSCATIACI